jgi:hypothetical protein
VGTIRHVDVETLTARPMGIALRYGPSRER